MLTSSSMIQSSSTECLPSDDVQDKEESETVQLGELWELNTTRTVSNGEDRDLTA